MREIGGKGNRGWDWTMDLLASVEPTEVGGISPNTISIILLFIYVSYLNSSEACVSLIL